MPHELRRWRLLALVLALCIPLLGMAFARLQNGAPAPAATAAAPDVSPTAASRAREIPVEIKVTPPPAPPDLPAPAPPAGSPEPAAGDPGGGTLAFAWDRNGHEDLYALASGSRTPVRLTSDGANRDPAWSPDGRYLAFSGMRAVAGTDRWNWDIYVLEVATGKLSRVTDDPEADLRPNWSPDGNWLAFESYRTGNFDIFITSRDGAQVYQVTGSAYADLAPAWSPDGRALAFTSYRGGNKDIWLALLSDALDEHAINLTGTPDRDEDDAAWAPDGALLAFHDASSGAPVVYALPMRGTAVAGEPRALAPGARPAWSPDGRRVLTVFVPEHDPTQTYLLAGVARGEPGPAWAAFGGALAIGEPAWTASALPAGAGQSVDQGEPAGRLRFAAWLGQGMTDDGLYSTQLNADALDAISPYWYTPDTRGYLRGYLTADDPAFVQFVHEHALALVPTIATQGDAAAASYLLNNAERRRTLIRNILARLETYGYHGVDLDFEGLGGSDRDAFTQFVRELAVALHAEDLHLSVTVYAKAADQSWFTSHDYPALGQYADEIRIMAYEYHTVAGGSGPVGPIYWQDAVLAYAVSQIPAHKVVLGLHLYGTDWGGGARAMVYRDIAETLASTRATVYWDENAQEATFNYWDGGSIHRVWFPNGQFVQARIGLAQRYGIAGLCFWRLGGEDPALWDVLRAAR
jgi:spore germination protein